MGAVLTDLLSASSGLGETGNLSIVRTAFPLAPDNAQLVDDQTIAAAVESYAQRATNVTTAAGLRIRTSFDDWYYRIHLTPNNFSLGNLAGDQQRDLVLWNAFFEPVAVTSLALLDGEGVDYLSDFVTPGILPALAYVEYSFNISVQGPPIIATTARWTIDGVPYDVTFSGTRTTLFPFRPNWSTAFRETMEAKTAMQTTYTGKEHRAALREVPRRIFEYSVRLFGDEVQLFDNLNFGWTGRMMSLPLWHEKAHLTAAASAGATQVFLPTAMRSFVDGGSAVIVGSALDLEPLQIDQVLSDRLVLKGPLVKSWPLSARVYPVLTCAPQDTIATSRRVPTHVDATVRFTASPQDAVVRPYNAVPPATYLGEELYTRETNWVSPLSIETDARRSDVDNGIGPIRLKRKASFPLVTRSMRWLCKSLEENYDLYSFARRRDGKRVPVWMPSGVDDFTLTNDIEAGQSSFFVTRSQYMALVGVHPARKHIVLILRGGVRLPMRVIDVVDAGAGRSLVTVDYGFNTAIPKGQVKRISFLGLYRLSADAFTVPWVTDEVSDVEAKFTLVEPV